jgi:hypothetical protein
MICLGRLTRQDLHRHETMDSVRPAYHRTEVTLAEMVA